MSDVTISRNKNQLIFNYQSISKFANDLETYNKAVWNDEYGKTKVEIGNSLFLKKIKLITKSSGVSLIWSPLINHLHFYDMKLINFHENSENPKYVVSIGASKEHNDAKKLYYNNNVNRFTPFICIPVPLSNDAFCTNRCNLDYESIKYASVESIYPSEILIDLNLLTKIDEKLNRNGLGEIIGFLYSLKDYFSKFSLKIDDRIFINMKKRINSLLYNLEYSNQEIWLKELAIILLMKCLFMRVNKNNNIAAAGDHLLAYALESSMISSIMKDMLPSHGELVFLGAIIMSVLFPEWSKDLFSLRALIEINNKFSIVSRESYNFMVKVFGCSLINDAVNMRPNRPSCLSNINKNQIIRATRNLIKVREMFNY